MKIRSGFVANSSSSSFCLYGINVRDYDLTLLDKISVDYNLRLVVKQDEDNCYIGIEPWGFFTNITLDEQMEMLKRALSELLDQDIEDDDLEWHNEEIYN